MPGYCNLFTKCYHVQGLDVPNDGTFSGAMEQFQPDTSKRSKILHVHSWNQAWMTGSVHCLHQWATSNMIFIIQQKCKKACMIINH